MAHIVRAKYLRTLKIYAYVYSFLIVVGWIINLIGIVDLSLSLPIVIAALMPVAYYLLLFSLAEKRYGRYMAYVAGIAITAVPMFLIAVVTGSYITLFINSGALATLIFLSAMVGPTVPVGLVWVVGVGYIVAFSSHIPSVEAIRLTIFILLGYVVAAVIGWIVFRRFYIREDPELERLKRTLRGEQLKSEAVIASMSDGIAIVDRTGIVIHANPRFLEMLDISLAEIVGKHYSKVTTPRLRIVGSSSTHPRMGQNIDTVFKTKQSVVVDSITLEYIDGRGFTDFATSISPLKNEEGELGGVTVILRDITNLMKVQRMKDALIATASHELRTPITVIAGYADLLLGTENGGLNEKQVHYLERTKETTAHLTQMVNDMLDISRLESNQRENAPMPLNVQSILESIVEGKLSLFASKQLSLYLDAETGKIFADESRFRQVVGNLLSNAFKFTPEEGKVLVLGKVIDDVYEIAVTDTGPGIPEERMSEIFDKFSKLDDTGSIPGTGLGLAIAKNIIDNWKGRITVENRPEGGAIFRFTVPLAQKNTNEEVAKGNENTDR